jgi:hypothetical protein
MADDFTNNENRARLRDSINKPFDMPASGGVASASPPNDLPPPIRGDAPMTLSPHDGGAPNASKPTTAAIHTGPISPGYTGVSPLVRLRQGPARVRRAHPRSCSAQIGPGACDRTALGSACLRPRAIGQFW